MSRLALLLETLENDVKNSDGFFFKGLKSMIFEVLALHFCSVYAVKVYKILVYV